ncbi:MarR family winged helix-turn-helix transcriptional regulator [Microbacterium esteraromaticum]|uniref:MarR family winged helix-turn-helix transcriptional regulator n=1 Tax=Microbacterium esteraromaticum TaxID=57043 RepID=UPI00195D1357|nr:MarR family transcriptional regulator [Microbacterium esteraromaticum]MBM7465079.1 DNA-binding MarR family transcriptional regulator [Microbacterium esteraromaticum]
MPQEKPSQARIVMHDPRLNDPAQEIVRTGDLAAGELESVLEVLDAMRRWREAERETSEASQKYMKLGASDMRALRMLIAAGNQNVPITPSAMAGHLGISAASTTKLLDRLERGGHIVRLAHPDDRRSLVIQVTEHTRLAARATVGREHARRFDVVAALAPEQRRVIADFFDAMAATAQRDAV